MTIFFLILLLLSCAALTGFMMRGFAHLKSFPKQEFFSRLGSTKPFLGEFHELIILPAIRIYRENFLPGFYKEIEKLIRRFRIIILRLECLLLRFTEYIKGKRSMPTNGAHKSHYWEQLNQCKNGINKQDNEKSENL